MRFAFQEALGYEFPKTRPPFLEKLELDGYCEALNLAFEYHGRQHFESIPFFEKDGQTFAKRIENDRRKIALCSRYGIDLIVIPYNHVKKICRDEINTLVRGILKGRGLLPHG